MHSRTDVKLSHWNLSSLERVSKPLPRLKEENHGKNHLPTNSAKRLSGFMWNAYRPVAVSAWYIVEVFEEDSVMTWNNLK